MRELEIWSGGQTGADRAALDAALARGLRHGGWIPRGRLAEDGTVPARYANLRETDSPDYETRTVLNVRETDATLVLRWGPAAGGTRYTIERALGLGKPLLEIDLACTPPTVAARAVGVWLDELPAGLRLNVAGPRASQAPLIYDRVLEVLCRALALGPGGPAGPA